MPVQRAISQCAPAGRWLRSAARPHAPGFSLLYPGQPQARRACRAGSRPAS